MSSLDEYYDEHAPTSRDRLAAKQAQQQAQADREGVPLETIRYREREAAKVENRPPSGSGMRPPRQRSPAR